MSEQQIPNVSDGAVTGLGHDPVQGATISEHDPVETVDHPHNTSDDTAGEPAADDAHVGGQVDDGVPEDETPVVPDGTQDEQDPPLEPSEPDEGTGAPTDPSEAGSEEPANPEGTVDGGNPPTE